MQIQINTCDCNYLFIYFAFYLYFYCTLLNQYHTEFNIRKEIVRDKNNNTKRNTQAKLIMKIHEGIGLVWRINVSQEVLCSSCERIKSEK